MKDPTRKGAVLICVIAVHGVMLFVLTSIRSPKRDTAEAKSGLLFFVEAQKKKPVAATQPLPQSRATNVPAPTRAADAITTDESQEVSVYPPKIDWVGERSITAGDIVSAELAKSKESRLFSKPKVIELPKERSKPKAGDSQRFDNGELITWISDRCYATNLPPVAPRLDPNAMNVVCKNDKEPTRDDYFDHLKPGYLIPAGEKRPEMIGIFDDKAKCEHSLLACK